LLFKNIKLHIKKFLKNNRYSFQKKTRKQKNRWFGFLFQKRVFLKLDYLSIFLSFSLDRMIWNKSSRHYQFDWVCAAHLQYMPLVLKKLKITGI